MWSDALGVLMTALEISRACVNREAYLEAELLLNIGENVFFDLDELTLVRPILENVGMV